MFRAKRRFGRRSASGVPEYVRTIRREVDAQQKRFGMVRPSALAVLTFKAISNLIGS